MANIGFARVSTQAQELTDQLTRLDEYGCIKIFSGKHSGKADTNKEVLDELLGYVRDGDTVVVTKLDRLGRSLSQVLQVLDQLKEKGVNLVALDQGIDTSNDDPMNTAMIQLLGMFAEMERNFIVSRTQEGKRASGNFGGRKPKLTDDQKKDIKAKLAGGASKLQLSKEYNVSRGTILNIERS
ncbi:recombinase family protein [Vibrio cyclitrophicus]|nr:recombinase family protein [Vibrio cyclitrophicus]UPR50893.1 recombinase family protein [Vibrio cyclitrophicus]